jgi:peptide deformylase
VGVRAVVSLPDRVLKERARELNGKVNHELMGDLVDTMHASPACVGLAAPQIGVPERVIVVDVSAHPKTTACHGLVVVTDPVIIQTEGRKVGREGCMSVPDFTANVARATRVVVQGISPAGEDLVIATEGFEACAFQHEIDHLDGLLILDRVESLGTDVFRRKTYR